MIPFKLTYTNTEKTDDYNRFFKLKNNAKNIGFFD
jgi:hypothetical protein